MDNLKKTEQEFLISSELTLFYKKRREFDYVKIVIDESKNIIDKEIFVNEYKDLNNEEKLILLRLMTKRYTLAQNDKDIDTMEKLNELKNKYFKKGVYSE